jgi:2-methylcitrate dehydratase PrpD
MDGTGYAEGNPVEIELKDGTVLSAWGKARGAIDNPVSRDEVVAKFRKVTARSLDARSQDAIIGHCLGLDSAEDISPLVSALRG